MTDVFLTGLAMILLVFSAGGLVYAIIRKKSKKIWIGLIALALVAPIIIVIIFNRDDIMNGIDPPEIGKEDSNKGSGGVFEAPKVAEPELDPIPGIEGYELPEDYNMFEDDSMVGTITPIENGGLRFSDGTHKVGQGLEPGLYDVEMPMEYKALLVKDRVFYVENYDRIESQQHQIFGEFGIEKVRVKLVEGDMLAFGGGEGIFMPAVQERTEYEELSLYPGVWTVGEDGIKPGRYSIIPLDDAVGKVIFYNKDGSSDGGGMLGKGQEPPAIIIDFLDGYEVHIRNMNFKLVPSAQ